MQYKIAFITTEFLRDFIDQAIKELQMGFSYTIYPYDNFYELTNIYNSIPKQIDAIITSGSFPEQVIRQSFPNSKRIIKAINNDDAGIFKLFLHLFNENKQLDLNRMYADLFEAVGLDWQMYLFKKNTASFSVYIEEYMRKASLNQLIEAEQYYLKKHLDLWKQKKIDFSITRFSSIALKLREEGVKVYFPYPSLGYIRSICLSAIQEIRIQSMRENQFAAIMLTLTNQQHYMQIHKHRLYKTLKRFNKKFQLELLIQERQNGFELLTDHKTVSKVTEGFTSCRLQRYFKENLDFPVIVGYGIGVDMYQARINAVDANREANLQPVGESCLINEKDVLIAPLHYSNKLIIPRKATSYVKDVSSRSGLSNLTVQKILSATGDLPNNQVTAKELARKLSITTRSANRFLSAMLQAGVAEVIEHRKNTTKGRPERIFRITAE